MDKKERVYKCENDNVVAPTNGTMVSVCLAATGMCTMLTIACFGCLYYRMSEQQLVGNIVDYTKIPGDLLLFGILGFILAFVAIGCLIVSIIYLVRHIQDKRRVVNPRHAYTTIKGGRYDE